MRTAIFITAFIVISTVTAFLIRLSGEAKKADSPEKSQTIGINPPVKNRWELPDVLKEISGIDFLDQDRVACIQDEAGTIFIYNLRSSKIEKEIPFAGDGDYEGIALHGHDAYVLRSDGRIFEVANFMKDAKVQEYLTPLTAKHDTEGLSLDKKNNRLLITIKGYEPDQKDFKGVYAFNLSTRQLEKEPVFKVDLNHPHLEGFKKKKKASFNPSDIALHPGKDEIYLVEGSKPKILIMDFSGNINRVQEFEGADFTQPEGIAFAPDGTLYISNEGKDKKGNILHVSDF
ncbi:SdiA-regulated domain-containing protein [Desertivirga xinjiangensis]|uniref:SdiA-regulated domain-containing protein n=1 Tax=Desertivirga xinjiangensis TaxID=539206 RepID=UPI0021089755|nr:SdiA-regulated domain-containing protein [Pedobacter xinjiangensis]